jgi:hypothetical protein
MNTSWAINNYLLTELHLALAGFRNDLPISVLYAGVFFWTYLISFKDFFHHLLVKTGFFTYPRVCWGAKNEFRVVGIKPPIAKDPLQEAIRSTF